MGDCVGNQVLGGIFLYNYDVYEGNVDLLIDVYMIQMSGSRMKVAGRFKPCVHMGCFDLDVFVEMNQRSRKASNYE